MGLEHHRHRLGASRFLGGIEGARAAGLRVAVATVLTRSSYRHLAELAEAVVNPVFHEPRLYVQRLVHWVGENLGTPIAPDGSPIPPDAEMVLVMFDLMTDCEAFGKIVLRYQSLLCSLAYSSVGDLSQSEDIAQEAFVEACGSDDGERVEESFL